MVDERFIAGYTYENAYVLVPDAADYSTMGDLYSPYPSTLSARRPTERGDMPHHLLGAGPDAVRDRMLDIVTAVAFADDLERVL